MNKSRICRSKKGKGHVNSVSLVNVIDDNDMTNEVFEEGDGSNNSRPRAENSTRDPFRNILDATSDLWDELIKTHPEYSTLRHKLFPLYTELASPEYEVNLEEQDDDCYNSSFADRELLLQEAKLWKDLVMRIVQREMPYTLDDALKKLRTFDNLTEAGLSSMITALSENANNRTIFMNLNGAHLQSWMKRVARINEQYGHLPVFKDDNSNQEI